MPATAIFNSVQDDLIRVESAIEQVADVDFPLLAPMLKHVLQTKGKRVRPALVLLAASFNTYELNRLVPLAAAIELLHTATLIHDDLIDNSPTRRGMATLHSLTSTRATVLVGDYIFAKSAALCTETGSVPVMSVFGQTLMTICDGELRQIFTSGLPDQSQDDYYRKIERKTASLLRTATETGAILSEASPEQVAALRTYGHCLGMAFQIVDDVLDFIGDEEHLGKPVGSDLRQGTVTLPVIYVLQRDPACAPIRRVLDADGDLDEAVQEAVTVVRESGAIEYSLGEARRFCDIALDALRILPNTPNRQTLAELTDYVLTRVS